MSKENIEGRETQQPPPVNLLTDKRGGSHWSIQRDRIVTVSIALTIATASITLTVISYFLFVKEPPLPDELPPNVERQYNECIEKGVSREVGRDEVGDWYVTLGKDDPACDNWSP